MKVLKRMKLGDLLHSELIEDYSRVLLAYVSLLIQNAHLNGMGDKILEAGIDSGIEKQAVRRELNVLWTHVDSLTSNVNEFRAVIQSGSLPSLPA